MNSQQNKVNDYSLLSCAVIDLRLAMFSVFIDAIVYLFGAQGLCSRPDWARDGAGLWNSQKFSFWVFFQTWNKAEICNFDKQTEII